MFNSNQAILLVQKLKLAPRALFKSQGLNRKNLSICPKLLIVVELYGLVLNPRLKNRIPKANLQSLGPMFHHLLISLHQCSSIY
jgi:hypothetical protein